MILFTLYDISILPKRYCPVGLYAAFSKAKIRGSSFALAWTFSHQALRVLMESTIYDKCRINYKSDEHLRGVVKVSLHPKNWIYSPDIVYNRIEIFIYSVPV